MYSSRKGLTVEKTMEELYSDLLSDISGIESSDTETVDSNLPTKMCRKFRSLVFGDGSDSERSGTDRSDSEMSEKSDTETVDGWSKSGKTPNAERFLGNPGVDVDVDGPSDINQVVSTVIGDYLIQLFAEQSDLYHRRNVGKWKISPKSLKWTDIITAETEKFLGLILLMGQVRKDNVKH
jgi:hypothetical protein